MQSNTPAVENQPINFSNFTIAKKVHKADLFTIRDARYIGSDGFVVPSDFEEFYERFPDYVRKWVSKHADRSAPKEDVEDLTQELLIHLYHLPQTSKHRESGKKDIVQTFDPAKHYGANQARFQNYVNLCLANKLKTFHSKRMNDALCRPGNLSLDEQTERKDSRSVDDEYCHLHSEYLRRAVKSSEKQASDRAFLQEFVNFVQREDPNVLSAIEALLATGTQGEAVEWLIITESEFARIRARLSQLNKGFLSGSPVPRQRKLYKKRIRKT